MKIIFFLLLNLIAIALSSSDSASIYYMATETEEVTWVSGNYGSSGSANSDGQFVLTGGLSELPESFPLYNVSEFMLTGANAVYSIDNKMFLNEPWGMMKNNRAFHASFTHNDIIYVWGGGSNVLESFSFLTRAWTEIQITGTVPNLFAFGYSYLGNELYVYGGILDSDEINSNFYVLNLDTFAWSSMPLSGTSIPPLIAPSLLCSGSYCYLSGGMDNSNVYSSIYSINIDSLAAQLIGDMSEPRFGGISLLIDSTTFVYAFGMNNEWKTTHSTYTINLQQSTISTVQYSNNVKFPDGNLHAISTSIGSMQYLIFGGSMRTDPWTFTSSPTIWWFDYSSSYFSVVSCYPGNQAYNTICMPPIYECGTNLIQENYVSSLIDDILSQNYDYTVKSCC